MDGKWHVQGEKTVYDNEWTKVDLVDVELPDGTVIEHHQVRAKVEKAVATLCYDPEKGVLLIWRHRFINDKWGWELPAGMVEANENSETAAKRELHEETGWQVAKATKFLSYNPMAGFVKETYDCFYAEDATWVGPGRDENEAADVAWTSLDQLRTLIDKGEMTDGFSLTAVLFALTFGPLRGK